MNNTPSKKILFICLFPALFLVAFFIFIVLFMIIAQSFGYFNSLGESEFSLKHWDAVLHNPQTWLFLKYSFRQGFLSAIGSVMLAYPFALWLRNPFVGSTFIMNLLRIPMLIPGLVAAFLFLNIISYHGILNELLVRLHIFKQPHRMQNDSWGLGVLLLQLWKNMPFALLLLSGSLKNISLEIFDAARDLGASKVTLVWRIFIPLSLSSMRAAMIIIFIGALGDFSFNAVAGPHSLQSISQYIVTTTQQFYEINQAADITLLMLIVSLIGILLLMILIKLLDWFTRKEL